MQRRDFLFVQSTTEQGGAETVLLNALAASPELRGRSAVATLGFGDGDLPARMRTEGVEVVELGRARLRHPVGALQLVWRLAAESRKRGVRVLVGNGAHPQVFAAAASRLARSRNAYFVHMIHQERLLANGAIDVLAISSARDLAIANSRASLAAMRNLRPSLRAELAYPGTALHLVEDTDARAARRELGAGREDVLFGIFGRLQAWKGQDVFLEACGRVAASLRATRFAVVGGSVFGLEPRFEAALREKARTLGLADRVVFTGHRTDVARLMAACDVVCHASRGAEPFGMVVVEAMAQGRPVIATAAGGPAEIVADGRSGVLVPPDDSSALAEAMLRLARDSNLREMLGAGARRRVREHFTSDGFARRLLELLTQVS